jgi:hypothetical protein
MKPNMEKILFEGVVMDARKTLTTFPPSEVIDINYEVEPCNVYDITYNERTGQTEQKLAYVDNKGWVQICLPVFNGLKPGDKIRIVKV